MFSTIKKFFTQEITLKPKSYDDGLKLLTVEEITQHFSQCEENDIGFRENKELIKRIKSEIKPNRKNVFILDDVCEVAEILKEELEEYLITKGIRDNFNVITMCTKDVGFDFFSILANHKEIVVDSVVTDITFGGNQKFEQ